ncbi:MAG: Antibiotic biosynthesis monooxygenase, partial [uncultured Propionibacteriaceae bacterium]
DPRYRVRQLVRTTGGVGLGRCPQHQLPPDRPFRRLASGHRSLLRPPAPRGALHRRRV